MASHVIRSADEFLTLREEWNELASNAANPLFDHDWFASCAEAFHDGSSLRVITVRQGQTLVGAAPLAREATSAGHRLLLIGASRLYEPGCWLAASSDAISELAEQAVRLREPMLLQRIPADSPLCRILAGIPSHRALTLIRAAAPTLAVVPSTSWDSYYNGLSSRITDNLRRLRRKAERTLGAMSVVRAEPRPGEVDALLETVVAIEGSGWKGQRGSALGARHDLRNFFHRYCHRAAASRQLRVAVLSFGAHVAAVELSVEAYNRMWQLKIGYHDSLASYYPGLHLTESSLKSAFDRRLDAYEYLGVAEPWQERWQPVSRPYRGLSFYPCSTSGMVGACRDIAGAVWRRSLRTLHSNAAGVGE